MPLTPEEVREACALICSAMIRLDKVGRTENERHKARIRRRAFLDVKKAIMELSEEDLKVLLNGAKVPLALVDITFERRLKENTNETLCAASSAARDAGSSC